MMKIPSSVTTNENTKRKVTSDHNNHGAAVQEKRSDEANFPHYKRVSDYLLGTCIGEGSFAKVRIGLHSPTQEKVAIKIINKATARRDSYVYKNLHREGKLMQMLRHPNIVQVFDILETGNNYYLVTELCNGGELIDIITEQGSLPEDTARKYMSQLVNAVFYLHDRKIVHRDLKIENLLLDSDDNIKIIDFGLSNLLPDTNSDVSRCLSTQCGSPAYAAPELLAKQSYGAKVDVWSIGVITFALLVGKLPFTVEPFNISRLCKKMIRGEMNSIPTSVSPQCRFFIKKLLTPDQTHRPTIHEVTRLKWISAHQKSARKQNNNAELLLFRDHLGEVGFRRPSSCFFSAPPIDSSIVTEMASTYGFLCTEVIQCVQKNRPGPALATYHLLGKKKECDKPLTIQTEKITPTLVEIQGAQPNFLCDNHNRTDDSSSKVVCKGNFVSSPLLPKIQTLDATKEAVIESNKTLNPFQKEKSHNQTKEKLLPSRERIPLANNPISQNTKEKHPEEKNLVIPSLRIQAPTDPDLITVIGDHLSNYVRVTKPSEEEPSEKRETDADLPSSYVPEHTNIRTSETGVNETSQNSNVDELLASMRKTRHLLYNRQQQEDDDRFHHRTIDDMDKQGDSGATEEQSLKAGCLNPRTSLYPLTTSPVSGENVKDTRSISHQVKLSKNECQVVHSPMSSTRPASHNAVLSEPSYSLTRRRSHAFMPSSPLPSRYIPEKKSTPTDAKNSFAISPRKPEYTNHIPTTLPVIVPKPRSPTTVKKEHLFASGNSRLARHSLPISNGNFYRHNRHSVTLPNNESDLVKQELESGDNRTSKTPQRKNACRNENSSSREFLHKHSYYRKNGLEKSTPLLRKHGKAISEPIAAAISYLTKNKTIRREKFPSAGTT